MPRNTASSRLSIDPTLPERKLSALRRTQEDWEKQRREARYSSRVFGWLGAVVAFLLSVAVGAVTGELAVMVVVFVLVFVAIRVGVSMWLLRQEDALQRLLRENEKHFVGPGQLHEHECALLVRAQRAVTRVLRSPLHEKGILNDQAQEKVVLNDVEWSIAQQLLRQSERRRGIEEVPTTGERSRRAAEHALDTLNAEQEKTVGQVDTIVRMANQVTEAERDLIDRANALRLESMQVDDPWVHAAAKVDSESLDSLSRARDIGQQIAELAASEKRFS